MKSPISLPRGRDIKNDLIAGLTTGLVQIPDAMASAILAAVKPVNGLNTLVIGTPIGALFAGSVFMTVTTTGAIALAVADAVGDAGADERTGVLIMLTLMVGVIQLALGLFKLGWITKFVSNSVMVGFITGVCILIILGQLGDLTGYSSEYSNKVVKTVDLVLNFDEVSWTTLGVGLATVGLILAFGRTPARKFAMVLAFAVVTVGVVVLGLGVQLVSDVAAIPSGLPEFQVPDFSKAAELIVPAIAIAAIGLIQGAGVSKSVPNPGGEYGDDSRDFAAQGAANAAVSFFQGMPIGGSVSASALNVSSGARSRWANVYSGVIVAVVLVLFGSAIEKVPMATVAALLIVAAVGSLKPAAILEVWRTNWAARAIMLTTLALTLLLPIQYAVLLGVAVSTIQYISSASLDVKVRRLVREGEELFREEDPPERVPDREVTILDIYGSIFYAAADVIAGKLPDVRDAKGAVLVLRLRGRGQVGSSAIGLFRRYATDLQQGGGALLLAGVGHDMADQLKRTGIEDLLGQHSVFPARSLVYRSTEAAYEEGRRRLASETPA
ncbi:MAG TPA: SulP family inorganic anion transporter [Thermoleophilia bacterium]|nr:SulP family inorganic anion transporter [Thermoleophilia bacterium]